MSEVFISLLTNTVVTLGALFTLLAGILALQIQRRKKREASMQSQISEQIAQEPDNFGIGIQPARQGYGREVTAAAIGVAAEHVLHPHPSPAERPAKPSLQRPSRANDGADEAVAFIPEL